MDNEQAPQFTQLAGDDHRLAYRASAAAGAGVGVMWLGGFRSDMLGGKATALHALAEDEARAYVRFDYFGHGESDGAFADGTIGRWRADALHMLDALTEGPQVLVGSSMGGWMALLCALARPDRVAGLVLIAPAPDFTREIAPADNLEAQAALARDGVWMRPSDYGDPTPISRAFLTEAEDHLVLGEAGATVPVTVPVRIVHGQQDADVPWRRSLDLAARLESADVTLTFIKSGDHRLSEPADIARLEGVVSDLCAQLDAAHAASPSR